MIFFWMEGMHDMSKTIVAMLAIVGVVSLSGCAGDWIGKGKGKAPPPVVAEEPAPVYK
jgi:hypothetical protein